MDEQLTLAQTGPLAAPARLTIEQAFAAVTGGQLGSEQLAVMKELLKMNAEQQFASAFSQVQAECRTVRASKSVPARDGTIKYWYAPYEEILEMVAPILRRHGFTVSFDTDFAEGRIIATCTLLHIGGHSRSHKALVRIGSGPHGASETQADGAAITYAKRYAFCNALNITIEHDTDGADDARNEGNDETISEKEASDLSDWVEAVSADPAKFLAFADAKSFGTIRKSKLPELHRMLRAKEKR